jgi:hypothetical protein
VVAAVLRWIAQFTDSSGIKARSVIAVPLNLCVWIAVAFFASLGLAIGILASFGHEQRGVRAFSWLVDSAGIPESALI